MKSSHLCFLVAVFFPTLLRNRILRHLFIRRRGIRQTHNRSRIVAKPDKRPNAGFPRERLCA